MSTANTEFTWKLNATIQETMEVGNSVFMNVVTDVHWVLIGTRVIEEEPISYQIHGSVSVPAPEEGAKNNFIDISMIETMDADTKLSTITGWAEMVEPGFIEKTKQQLDAIIDSKTNAPVRVIRSIL